MNRVTIRNKNLAAVHTAHRKEAKESPGTEVGEDANQETDRNRTCAQRRRC